MTSPQANHFKSEIAVTENSSPPRDKSLPPMARTPADKPLNEMTAIEYYWYHKNQADNQDGKNSSRKSISYGLSSHPEK